jgi:hypothetical protein
MAIASPDTVQPVMSRAPPFLPAQGKTGLASFAACGAPPDRLGTAQNKPGGVVHQSSQLNDRHGPARGQTALCLLRAGWPSKTALAHLGGRTDPVAVVRPLAARHPSRVTKGQA